MLTAVDECADEWDQLLDYLHAQEQQQIQWQISRSIYASTDPLIGSWQIVAIDVLQARRVARGAGSLS